MVTLGHVQFQLTIRNKVSHAKKILGKNGTLVVTSQLFGDGEQVIIQEYQWLDLKPFVQPDRSLKLPVTWPLEKTQGVAAEAKVTLDLRDKKGNLGATSIPLANAQTWLQQVSGNLSQQSQMLSRLKHNQMAPARLAQVLTDKLSPTQVIACHNAFALANRPVQRAQFRHCTQNHIRLFGEQTLNDNCADNTQLLFDQLQQQARQSCPANALVKQKFWPDWQGEVMLALEQRLHDRVPEKYRYGQTPIAENLAKVLANYVKLTGNHDSANFLVNEWRLVDQRLHSLEKVHRDLVATKVFRDTVVSELLAATVTQNFKERQPLADACANEVIHENAKRLCYVFASDVAEAVIKPYGFSNLFDFNQGVAQTRDRYLKATAARLGDELAEQSYQQIRSWARGFGEQNFYQDQCINEILFPLSQAVLGQQWPQAEFFARGREYRVALKEMANDHEALVQEIWDQLKNQSLANSQSHSDETCLSQASSKAVFEALYTTHPRIKQSLNVPLVAEQSRQFF